MNNDTFQVVKTGHHYDLATTLFRRVIRLRRPMDNGVIPYETFVPLPAARRPIIIGGTCANPTVCTGPDLSAV